MLKLFNMDLSPLWTWSLPGSPLGSHNSSLGSLLQPHTTLFSSLNVCPALSHPHGFVVIQSSSARSYISTISWPTQKLPLILQLFPQRKPSLFLQKDQRSCLHTPRESCTFLSNLLSHNIIQLCLPVSFTIHLNSMRTEIIPVCPQNLVYCLTCSCSIKTCSKITNCRFKEKPNENIHLITQELYSILRLLSILPMLLRFKTFSVISNTS